GSLDLSTRVGDGLASEGSLTEGKSVLFGDWKQYVPQEEKSVLSTQDVLYDELNRTLQEGLSEEEVEASNENEVTIQELDAVLKEDEESESEVSPVLPSLLERSEEKASPVIPSVSENEGKLSVSGSEEKLSVSEKEEKQSVGLSEEKLSASQSEAKASSQSEVTEEFISTSPPRHVTFSQTPDSTESQPVPIILPQPDSTESQPVPIILLQPDSAESQPVPIVPPRPEEDDLP
ncbi:hypothetical protein WA577_003495, partial [Blastocystis sp. JDR]